MTESTVSMSISSSGTISSYGSDFSFSLSSTSSSLQSTVTADKFLGSSKVEDSDQDLIKQQRRCIKMLKAKLRYHQRKSSIFPENPKQGGISEGATVENGWKGMDCGEISAFGKKIHDEYKGGRSHVLEVDAADCKTSHSDPNNRDKWADDECSSWSVADHSISHAPSSAGNTFIRDLERKASQTDLMIVIQQLEDKNREVERLEKELSVCIETINKLKADLKSKERQLATVELERDLISADESQRRDEVRRLKAQKDMLARSWSTDERSIIAAIGDDTGKTNYVPTEGRTERKGFASSGQVSSDTKDGYDLDGDKPNHASQHISLNRGKLMPSRDSRGKSGDDSSIRTCQLTSSLKERQRAIEGKRHLENFDDVGQMALVSIDQQRIAAENSGEMRDSQGSDDTCKLKGKSPQTKFRQKPIAKWETKLSLDIQAVINENPNTEWALDATFLSKEKYRTGGGERFPIEERACTGANCGSSQCDVTTTTSNRIIETGQTTSERSIRAHTRCPIRFKPATINDCVECLSKMGGVDPTECLVRKTNISANDYNGEIQSPNTHRNSIVLSLQREVTKLKDEKLSVELELIDHLSIVDQEKQSLKSDMQKRICERDARIIELEAEVERLLNNSCGRIQVGVLEEQRHEFMDPSSPADN